MLANRLPSDMLAPGTRLGRYELLKRIAVGGMAELYLARSSGIQGFQKLVALKRMLPQYAASDEFVTMFLDEARLAATLQHANIAQVYDIGQCSQGLFFTMEFIHGEDARNLLKDRCRAAEPVPLVHAIAIVAGAAAGLHAAHEKTSYDGEPLGVVHRDVSPANVLISYDGCVKVVDFGVAKASRRQSETRAGTLKGKIAYMAPEQCLGDPVDRRADVFGLGILLYELTTNQRLFQGENEFAIMKRIVGDDVPPPSRSVPGYPAALERIVLKALARDPRERYHTAQALQIELEAFVNERGESMSAVRLGQYMRQVFAPDLEAWGRTLAAFEDDGAPDIEVLPAFETPTPPSFAPLEFDESSAPVDTGMFMLAIEPEASASVALREGSSRSVAQLPPEAGGWRAARAMLVAAAALAILTVVGWRVLRVGDVGVDDAAEELAAEARPAQATTIAPLAAGVTLEAALPVAARPDKASAAVEPRPRPRQDEPRRKVRPEVTVEPPPRKHRERPKRSWDPDSALPP